MKDILRRNLGYKIVSVLCAVLFWAWITNQISSSSLFGQQTHSVMLEISNQPSNLVVLSNIPTVTVRLAQNNPGVSINDLVAYVDLQEAVAGENTFEVKVNAPVGVAVEEVSPRNVVLNLDVVKDKTLSVVVQVTGTPAEGMVSGQPIVSPSVVNVRGAASILDKMNNVVVETSIEGARESLRMSRPVTFKDLEGKGIFTANPNLSSLKVQPETVDVIVPIYSQGTITKSVPLKVTATGTPANGLTVRLVSPIPASIELLGTNDRLKGIQEINLGNIDVSGLTENKVIDYPLNKITLPEGVKIAEGTKISVMVYIGGDSQQKNLTALPVELRNLGQDLTAEVISPVDITVSGYQEVLNNLKAADISLWVDASGLKEGTYADLDVYWKLPEGINMVKTPKVKLVIHNKNQTGTTTQNTDTGGFTLPVQIINILDGK